jgi:formate dehydrogenase maturation protein FdhE
VTIDFGADAVLAPAALSARTTTLYVRALARLTTLIDVAPLGNVIHRAPLLIEYWYDVIALPPLLDGGFTRSTKPRLIAVSRAMDGRPGGLFAAAAVKSIVVV